MSSKWSRPSRISICHLLRPSGCFQFSPTMPESMLVAVPHCSLFCKEVHLIAIRNSSKELFLSSPSLPWHVQEHAVQRSCRDEFGPYFDENKNLVFFFFGRFLPSLSRLRISFIPFSTHSQSIMCVHVGMSHAKIAHVATSNSPLTDVWPVRALIEWCMFNLLSSISLEIASHPGSKYERSINTCIICLN